MCNGAYLMIINTIILKLSFILEEFQLIKFFIFFNKTLFGPISRDKRVLSHKIKPSVSHQTLVFNSLFIFKINTIFISHIFLLIFIFLPLLM